MRIGIKPSCSISKSVDRAANPDRATVENMSVDHRGLDVIMAQEFLNGPNIVTRFQQMRSKGMAGAQGFAEAGQKFRFCSGPRRIARVSSNRYERI
jgi:hypothetical protein